VPTALWSVKRKESPVHIVRVMRRRGLVRWPMLVNAWLAEFKNGSDRWDRLRAA
jgi:hypothetical protein